MKSAMLGFATKMIPTKETANGPPIPSISRFEVRARWVAKTKKLKERK